MITVWTWPIQSFACYMATNTMVVMHAEGHHAPLQSNMTVMIPITYGNYQPEQLRKGVDTYRGVATLRIKALCQVLSNICLADWNIEANVLTYYRVATRGTAFKKLENF